jgi:hypothetical protein
MKINKILQFLRTYGGLQSDGQIHNRHIGGGHTESHASQLAVKKKTYLL